MDKGILGTTVPLTISYYCVQTHRGEVLNILSKKVLQLIDPVRCSTTCLFPHQPSHAGDAKACKHEHSAMAAPPGSINNSV